MKRYLNRLLLDNKYAEISWKEDHSHSGNGSTSTLIWSKAHSRENGWKGKLMYIIAHVSTWHTCTCTFVHIYMTYCPTYIHVFRFYVLIDWLKDSWTRALPKTYWWVYNLVIFFSDLLTLIQVEYQWHGCLVCMHTHMYVHVWVCTSTFPMFFSIDNENGEKQIYRLAPWGKHDLSIRCFADRYKASVHIFPYTIIITTSTTIDCMIWLILCSFILIVWRMRCLVLTTPHHVSIVIQSMYTACVVYGDGLIYCTCMCNMCFYFLI